MFSDLTDDEIDAICAGLTQGAAKVRFLERLGLRVARKPNGRPLVNRAHYDAVLGAKEAIDRAATRSRIKWGTPA